MRFYWSLGALPELSDLPLPEKRAVLKACLRKKSWAWPVLTMSGVFGAVLYVGVVAGVKPGTWQWVVNLFAGAYLGTLPMIQVQAYQLRPVIRAYLAGRSAEGDT